MRIPFFPKPGAESNNRKIFRAAVIIGLSTVVVKIAATLKELIVARFFGRSDSLDAFLVALILPGFLLNLLMAGLATASIPVIVETREHSGAQAAQKLFSSLLLLSAIILILMALLVGVLAPYYLRYLGSNFSPQKLTLTRELLYLLLPFMLFSGIATFVSAILNAGEKFALPALIPLATPLLIMTCVELGASRWGAFTLAAGTVVGSLVEVCLLWRTLEAHGMRLAFRWNGFDSGVRAVLVQYAPMFGATFLMGGTGVVDQSMAAMLSGGSVAALNYANRTIGAVLGIGATALSTASLPYFSQMAARSDWGGCRHTLKRYSILLLSTTVPSTILLVVFSQSLVRILFQRGAFSAADTALVGRVQAFYALQIPFYFVSMIFVRFLVSVRRNDVLLYVAAVNLTLDIVLNLVLMRVLGVAGIALSTSIVYVISTSLLMVTSLRLLARERSPVLSSAPRQGAIL